MKILVVSGGRIDENFALDFLNCHRFDQVIAVDGGLAFWDKIVNKGCQVGVPDHIVGDFDTIAPEIIKKYKDCGKCEIHEFDPEKDYTDTDIALKLAVDLCEKAKDEVQEIWILGATGTRLDHVLANMQMLLLPFEKNISAYIQDKTNRISLVSGERILRQAECFGKYVSLLPLTPVLKGIDLVGFKYPLKDKTVMLGESLCVSNELAADEARILIREGIALLMETKDA